MVCGRSPILGQFYGQGFNSNAIPRTADVEQIPKDTLTDALKEATRHTQKGKYHKIKHAAQLVGRINPLIVRGRAFRCSQLFETLERVITMGRP